MAQLLNLEQDVFIGNLHDALAERVGTDERLRAIVDLGLTSEAEVEKKGSPLDTLSSYLAGTLAYGKGERDMLLLRHEVRAVD